MKHMLALVLALCLILSLGLFPALADGEDTDPAEPPTTEQPENPTEPENPTGPADPDDPGEEPEEPVDPDLPGDEPNDPVEPVDPDNPTEEKQEPEVITITNKHGIPCLYQILDSENQEVLSLLLQGDETASIVGLPDGSYTIRETDILRGNVLDAREFSLFRETADPEEEPAEDTESEQEASKSEQDDALSFVFGSPSDAQLLRSPDENPWLRGASFYQQVGRDNRG